MADAERWLMTPEEFCARQLGQDELYERIDGISTLRHRMMTGSKARHDTVTVDVIVHLDIQLCGSRCRPTTSPIAIRTSIRSLRNPDVMVECAELVRDTDEAREPRLVVEVASPSTSGVDWMRTLPEYKRHPTLRCILLLETISPQALPYRRNGDEWTIEAFEGLDAVITSSKVGTLSTLSDIHEGLTFEPRWDLAK